MSGSEIYTDFGGGESLDFYLKKSGGFDFKKPPGYTPDSLAFLKVNKLNKHSILLN